MIATTKHPIEAPNAEVSWVYCLAPAMPWESLSAHGADQRTEPHVPRRATPDKPAATIIMDIVALRNSAVSLLRER
jgi:hypothetical protein